MNSCYFTQCIMNFTTWVYGCVCIKARVRVYFNSYIKIIKLERPQNDGKSWVCKNERWLTRMEKFIRARYEWKMLPLHAIVTICSNFAMTTTTTPYRPLVLCSSILATFLPPQQRHSSIVIRFIIRRLLACARCYITELCIKSKLSQTECKSILSTRCRYGSLILSLLLFFFVFSSKIQKYF